MKKTAYTFIIILPLTLSACGSTNEDRALSGAGIGAATGAIGSAVVGGNAAGGALVGAGVGAATGALTDEDEVNLDD